MLLALAILAALAGCVVVFLQFLALSGGMPEEHIAWKTIAACFGAAALLGAGWWFGW